MGKGADDEDPEEETEDAIADHNQIRDAVVAAEGLEVGSKDWYEAVARANKVNSDHMAEEERQGLTDFRRHAPLQLRRDLAVAFAAFEASHYQGVPPVNKDPDEYISEAERRVGDDHHSE